MSRTIDQKVVEMRFDNEQFERGVQRSVDSINGLKKSLDFTGVEKGINSVGDVLNGLPIDGIAKSVSALEDRFSAFGIAGMVVIERLTNACIDFVAKGLGGIVRTISSKGMTRAFNIENARFLLQGLLHGDEAEVKKIMDVASNSVLDTAYGYDEAAKAAANFVASGLKADQLIQPLRAIAGTAATFNADYGRIADLFATISGQGRVMTQNLYSFSALGMNYPAILAEYLRSFGSIEDLNNVMPELVAGIASNKKTLEAFNETGAITERVVREMVTAGLVDFKLFADSLDSTFGEHAKKANETFNGAMSNIRAAMGRIGAKFYTPLIEQNSEVVGLLNAVRVKFNEINKLIDPIATNVTSKVLDISKRIKDFLNGFDLSQSVKLQNFISKLGSSIDKLYEKATNVDLKKSFKPIIDAINYIRDGFKYALDPKAALTTERTEFTVIETIAQRLVASFSKLFGTLKDIRQAFRDFRESGGVSADTVGNIRDAFNGLMAAFDIFIKLLNGALKLVKPIASILASIGRILASIAGYIGRFIVNIDSATTIGKMFNKILDVMVGALSNLSVAFKNVSEFIGNMFEAIQRRFEFIKNFFKNFTDYFSGLGDFIIKIFGIVGNTIAEVFRGLGEAFKSNGGYNSILDFLNSILAVGVGFKLLNRKKEDGFTGFLNQLKDSFKDLIKLDVKPMINSLQELFDTFKENKDYKVFKDMAIAVAILAASLLILSSIDSAKLAQALGSITALFGALLGTMKLMSTMDLGNKDTVKKIGFLVVISASVLLLAIALKKIGSIDSDKIGGALFAISVLVAEMTAVVKLIAKEMKPGMVSKSITGIGSVILFAGAVYILALALKKIADLNIEQMVVATMSIVSLVGALYLAIKYASMIGEGSSNVLNGKTGLALIGFATAIFIVCQSVKTIASLDPDRLTDAMFSVIGLIGALGVAVRYSEMANVKAGAGFAMIGLAVSLLTLSLIIKKIGEMDLKQALTGVMGLSACVGMLVIASKMMKEVSAKDSSSLILVATSLLILAGVIKILGNMSVIQLGKALVTLAAAFVILGVSASYLSKFDTALLKIAKTMLIFGAAVLAVGVGVAALGVGLTSIAVSGAAAAGALVLIIEGLVLGLIDVVERSLVNILDAVKKIIIGLVDVIVECAPAIINGVLILLDEILKGIVVYLPSILDSLIEIVLLLLDGLAKAIPDILVKIFEVLDAIIIGVSKRLKEIGTTSFKDLLKALLEMAALMIGLSALSHLAIPALKGVAVFGLVLGALIGVIALIGGINEMLPGLETFVESGGDLLLAVGTAIGKFFGGIIGGIAEGVTHSLPAMAKDFSAFMENLKPFIEGSKDITPEAMAGVADLAKAILALTAANVIDQIAKFLGAETSLVSFGEELAEFGPYLATFANSVSDIDGDKVSASANAAKILAEMAKSLPNTGGVISWFTGDNPIEEFGSKLVSFGEDFKAYSNSISDIDSDAVSNSAVMAKSLSELASNLPNSGGIVSWFTGDNDIDDFGAALISFGGCLVKYSEKVSETDSEAVSRSIDDFRALLSLVEDVEGANGSALTSFSYGITSLGHTAVNDFIGCFTGAYTDVDEAVGGMIDTAANAIEVRIPIIVQSMYGITEVMVQALNDGKNWITVGSEIVADLVKGMKSKSKDAKDSIASLVLGMITEIRSRYLEFVQAGQYLVDGFVSGVGLKSTAVKLAAQKVGNDALNTLHNTLQVHSPSRLTEKTGKFFVLGFVNGMLENVDKAFTSAEEVGSSARDGLTKICSQIGELVSSSIDANPTIRPVLDLTDVQAKSKQLSHLVGTDQALAVGSGAKGTAAMLLNASRKTDSIQNGPIITIQNMNVDGAENPEEWAHQFVSSLYRQVRMGVV